GENHLSPVLTGRLEHDLRAADVREQRAERVLQHVLHAHGGGQVEHAIALGDDTVDERGVHHAPLDEAEAGMALEGTQVFETTGGQVVQGPHFVSSLEELLREMGPDEAGTSCDQYPHLFPRGADSRYLLPRSSAGPVSSMAGRAHRRRLRGCQRTRQYRYVKRRPPPLG